MLVQKPKTRKIPETGAWQESSSMWSFGPRITKRKAELEASRVMLVTSMMSQPGLGDFEARFAACRQWRKISLLVRKTTTTTKAGHNKRLHWTRPMHERTTEVSSTKLRVQSSEQDGRSCSSKARKYVH